MGWKVTLVGGVPEVFNVIFWDLVEGNIPATQNETAFIVKEKSIYNPL